MSIFVLWNATNYNSLIHISHGIIRVNGTRKRGRMQVPCVWVTSSKKVISLSKDVYPYLPPWFIVIFSNFSSVLRLSDLLRADITSWLITPPLNPRVVNTWGKYKGTNPTLMVFSLWSAINDRTRSRLYANWTHCSNLHRSYLLSAVFKYTHNNTVNAGFREQLGLHLLGPPMTVTFRQLLPHDCICDR